MKIESIPLTVEYPDIAESKPEAGPEKVLSRQEMMEKEYGEIIQGRERQYDRDCQGRPERMMMRSNLATHNNIVLGYANGLIESQPDLSKEEKTAATLATILHDSGKLNSDLMAHHLKGVEYAEAMLEGMKGQVFEGVEITDEIIEKVKEAIERHMNHPFLVKMNKGQRFPEPRDKVDQVVFDADMLANIGFKNIGFRLVSPDFLKQDAEAAAQKNTLILEETFENVLAGVRSLDKVVLSPSAKEKIRELIEATEKIFDHLKQNNILQTIQEEFSDNGKYDFDTIQAKGGPLKMKERLNETIRQIGLQLGINPKIIDNFKM